MRHCRLQTILSRFSLVDTTFPRLSSAYHSSYNVKIFLLNVFLTKNTKSRSLKECSPIKIICDASSLVKKLVSPFNVRGIMQGGLVISIAYRQGLSNGGFKALRLESALTGIDPIIVMDIILRNVWMVLWVSTVTETGFPVDSDANLCLLFEFNAISWLMSLSSMNECRTTELCWMDANDVEWIDFKGRNK